MYPNFTAKYLSLLGNEILDENGLPISTIKVLKEKNFFFEYRKPSMVIDLFDKTAFTPDIVGINNIDLDRFGFVVISEKGRLRGGQRVVYRLHNKERRVPDKAFMIDFIPKGHKVYYDIANKLIQLVGENSEGEWVAI